MQHRDAEFARDRGEREVAVDRRRGLDQDERRCAARSGARDERTAAVAQCDARGAEATPLERHRRRLVADRDHRGARIGDTHGRPEKRGDRVHTSRRSARGLRERQRREIESVEREETAGAHRVARIALGTDAARAVRPRRMRAARTPRRVGKTPLTQNCLKIHVHSIAGSARARKCETHDIRTLRMAFARPLHKRRAGVSERTHHGNPGVTSGA